MKKFIKMKTKILSILALLLMTVTQGAWAQATLTVFDGTEKYEYAPAYMWYFDKYSRSQYIIPAANLATMNGKIITALKYYSDKSNYTSTCNVDVYLKEVGYTTFNSTPTFETKSGIVYTGKLSFAGDGTLTITFTTPYTYNGGNLLIGMENTAKGNWASSQFYGQKVTGAVACGYNSTSLAAVTATRNDFIPKTTFTYETPFSGGSGTQASPYLIASTTDWNNLVTKVNGGETYSGKYFKMTANVGTVSTWMTGTFSGTFDGYGNTLTVGYSATTNNCAPFGYLNGTVQNLKVAGNISTSKQYAGGLAAWVKTGHTANVTNCRVAATINSTYSGDGSSAGFVAYVDGRLNVTGCAFTGTLAGSNAYAWGGFVSYNVGRSEITNCLFAPASVTAKADYSATVGRNGGGTLNFANFYYTQKFNTAQGMQARTIVKGDYVSTLSVTKGSGTTYNVAGITVYSNGVDYNSTFYGGSGQTVSLALTAETRSGYQFTQYAASQGTLSGQTATSATLTMPAANSTANDAVTVTAQYSVPAATAVDLGLPSGKKWADRNVGAASATGYGTYYAWSSSDIATAQWGNDWRMPTLTEAQELINNTDQEWATIGGVNGTKFMKKTDHSVYIFVPAAGWDGDGNGNIGTAGAYWTSTAQNESRAYEFVIRASGNATGNDNMTHQFTIRPVQMFAGEGTQASPYLIDSTTDWDNLSTAVNGGETYSGKYFKMTANVGTVSTTVGTSANPFNGTFDGNGHTLNVNISNSNADTRTAPFAWAGGSAVIKNLHVTGSLTNTARTSGIVGSCYSTTQISSCRVSATVSGGSHTSGISISGGQITNCLFDGKINGTGTTAGFATYPASGTKITNCLFKPQDGSSIPSSQGCFYASEGTAPTLTNCYYTSTAGGTAQGTNGSGMSAAEHVNALGPSNWKVVDGNAIPKVHPNLAGEGTEASPYLIASTTDWNNLVSAVNAGEAYSGNYFKMTANVGTVSTWMTGTFSGTFDGDGKTLTVDYSATTEKCAPFGTLGGASIQKLKVAGTITTNQKYAAGIAAYTTGTTYITNCLSSVAISSAVSGDGTHGGLVAVVDDVASLSMTGCAFTGKLLTTNSTTSCGGFVGFRWYTGTLTMTDCLYAPASATGSETWISDGEGQLGNANFSRWSNLTPTFTRCYYTTDFGSGNFTAQGIQARSISAGDYVTVANAGAATVYNVSGITSYGTGIKYNNVLYAGSGDNVSLNITAPAGHVINTVSYTYEGGSETTMNPVNGVYSITMPDANVTINVTFVGVSREIAGYGNDDQDFTKWVFIASPVSGSVAVGNVGNLVNTGATEEYNLYRFNQAADLEWENIKAVDNQGDSLHPDFKTLVNGHGYLYASKNDVTLMFMGPFNMKNDTTIALDYTTDNTDAGMRGWNLVGNPFPVRAYITDRSYYKISTDGTRVDPKEVSGACAIDSCSGVMVKANATGETVTFSKTPAEQSTNNGNLHIALGQTVFDRAGVSTGSTTLDKAIVSFNEGSALGKFYFGNQNANIYIPQNGKDYAIASVSAGTDVARYVSTEVPVNFKANENGTYTISVNPEGVEMAYLHLIDNMTGSDVDLLALRQAQGPATYTFTAKTTDYESRFKLVFVANNDEDGSSTGSETFAFYSNGNWIIANDGDATLQVIDLNGRILSSETVNGSVSKSIHAAPGVYMIRLINGENVKVQKVVIE